LISVARITSRPASWSSFTIPLNFAYDLDWILVRGVLVVRREERPLRGKGISDIAWLRVDGEPMSEEDWQQGFVKSLMVFLNGDALQELDDDGKRVRASLGGAWTVVVDTATEVGERNATLAAGSVARVEARSVIVVMRP
jgi:pullulanase/glycogen debranching enzyme